MENVPDAMDNGGQGPPSLEQICSRVAGGAEHGGAAAAADYGDVGWFVCCEEICLAGWVRA